MTIHLETPRLVLRVFTAEDVDNLVDLDADAEVMHFITGGLSTAREEIEHHVLPAWISSDADSWAPGFWAAEEKATGHFVGWFHLRPGEGHAPDELEIGYRLRRSAWGKGYATEGCLALIDKAFVELGVDRILAATMVVHTASRRVLEKAGLRLVRVFRADWPYAIPGDEHGDVEYAVSRTEWERRRADTAGKDVM